MKAGIYDPYLDTLGGGERYCLTLAEMLLKKGWHVDIFWSDFAIKNRLIERLNLDIGKINIVPRSKRWLSFGYDLFFHISDGSIPLMFSNNNLLHFQVPFHGVNGRSFFNKLKLMTANKIICNSLFTKGVVDKEYGANSIVVYPPVDVDQFLPAKKDKTILSVGRFSQLLQAKRQDLLIKVFKNMKKSFSKEMKDWKLILAGGTDIGGKEHFDSLKAESQGEKIEMIENPNFAVLKKLYSNASIFWAASGFGVNERDNPQKVEHFGIAVVESMASGCVPIIGDKGGFKEIITDGHDGYLWDEEEDLIKKTIRLIRNSETMNRISKSAVQTSKKFSKIKFYESFENIIR
jgi:glycosyltransferase involved in cell wall biosynthesis